MLLVEKEIFYIRVMINDLNDYIKKAAVELNDMKNS